MRPTSSTERCIAHAHPKTTGKVIKPAQPQNKRIGVARVYFVLFSVRTSASTLGGASNVK
jgi:hypothetical protein